MAEADYIVVGAGSAGCAVAGRLSADPRASVLLLEAGPRDRNPFIAIPKGFAMILGRNRFAWSFPVASREAGLRDEVWQRGKVLGGSSAINGMIYNRGGPADFDRLAALGNPEWSWDAMLATYREIEDHALGPSATRGVGGPLHVSPFPDPDPIGERVIAAGEAIGLTRVADCNESDAPRIGYTMCTLRRGRRVSAAHAFIHPVAGRPNLRIETGAHAVRLLREGDRIVGVAARRGGALVEHRARRDVILSLGVLGTPKLLQLSGIGPAEVLRAAGIDVVVDAPNVGRNLREHRSPMFQYRLNRRAGYNRIFASRPRRLLAGARYLIDRRGVIAQPSYDIAAFMKTRPELERPDVQLLIAPFSRGPLAAGFEIEREPGLQALGIVLRPESRGEVAIVSADPDAPAEIVPNFLAAPYDRATVAGLYRQTRALFAAGPIADLVDRETSPGPEIDGDDETLAEHARIAGYANYHGVGTAAMGPGEDAVVDGRLRVRGVSGLRVVDGSVFPTMVSCGTNAPAMALGWRAGELILADR